MHYCSRRRKLFVAMIVILFSCITFPAFSPLKVSMQCLSQKFVGVAYLRQHATLSIGGVIAPITFMVCRPGSTRPKWSMSTEAWPSGSCLRQTRVIISVHIWPFCDFVLQYFYEIYLHLCCLERQCEILCLYDHTFYERTKVAALVRNLYDFRSHAKSTF